MNIMSNLIGSLLDSVSVTCGMSASEIIDEMYPETETVTKAKSAKPLNIDPVK